jgi:hypothetical protein
MTIFRHKNGLLYMLAQGRQWNRELEAIPYLHDLKIRRPKIADFVAVAEK